ncbi:MAG TPA: YciI family protein [Devosia sp.]|nr:YciI family protein [Devosia sp.]
MRYLLMLYADEKAGMAIPKAEMAKVMEKMYAYRDTLAKAGAFVATHALARTHEAKTLRMEGGAVDPGTFVNDTGELTVHDGPYADTREQLGGYFIIEAPDMDAAIAWAKQCPAAQWGPVEIRPYNPAVSP